MADVVTPNAWGAVSAAITALEGGADEQVRSIATLIEHGWWRRFTLPNGQLVEHPSFAHFVRAEQLEGLGIHDPRAWARSLGDFSSFKKAADLIVRTLGDEIPELGKHGGDGGVGVCNTKSETDADYVIARLKRDDPELATEVIHGNITPHAAAIKAGIRRPRATFVTDSIDGALAALLRHFSYEDILAALKRVQP